MFGGLNDGIGTYRRPTEEPLVLSNVFDNNNVHMTVSPVTPFPDAKVVLRVTAAPQLSGQLANCGVSLPSGDVGTLVVLFAEGIYQPEAKSWLGYWQPGFGKGQLFWEKHEPSYLRTIELARITYAISRSAAY